MISGCVSNMRQITETERKMKKALITGITGQDGSYLAELLLSKGYEVHGIIRRASSFNTQRINHIYTDPHDPKTRLFLHYGDLSDSGMLMEIVLNVRPDEIYHLGAQSHVRVSFDMPEYTGNITGIGTTRILETIRRSRLKTKFYQASSSEMFGGSLKPQNEDTPFRPCSPYAAAKVYAYWMAVNYRKAYGIFACNGILFNHESPRRGETFVTRKITRGIANMLKGRQKKIYLGNLDAMRDWGFAPEYVEAMWMMLQQARPDDYVIGTGESHSVREFVEKAFEYVGIRIGWSGKGVHQRGIIRHADAVWRHLLSEGDRVVEIDTRYIRPTEVDYLKADIRKAKRALKWQPKVDFDDLVKIMVDYDMSASGLESPGEGVEISKRKGFGYTNHHLSLCDKLGEGH